MKPRIRWGRTEDGYCESKCGRFKIEPCYLGRVRPMLYVLVDTKRPPEIDQWRYSEMTLRQAKARAEIVAAGPGPSTPQIDPDLI